ncbi:DUF2304 domain-containing protein [Clostridiaceae bacterium 35-E11]
MNPRLQIFLIIITVLFIVFMISMLKKEKIGTKYSLVWLFTGIGMLIIAIFPNIAGNVSFLLGIVDPVNTVFYFGIFFVLVILFSLTIAISRQSSKLKELTQTVALLEYKLQNICNDLKK